MRGEAGLGSDLPRGKFMIAIILWQTTQTASLVMVADR